MQGAERIFYIWKFESWWVASKHSIFHPQGRKHLFGEFYWRL